MPNWYLAAGCISQTVWNHLHGFEPSYGINDYDLIYYDDKDITSESQEEYLNDAKELFKDLGVSIDVVNEARVHLWFGDFFGYDIKPYRSAEDAIATWPYNSTCVGARYENGKFEVYAPHGLGDIFELTIRLNKDTIFNESSYKDKAPRWMKVWPKLKLIK